MRTRLARLAARIPYPRTVAVAVALAAALLIVPNPAGADNPSTTAQLSGTVWSVQIGVAPYPDHQFTLFPGGIIQSSNPTGVQLKSDGSGETDATGDGYYWPGPHAGQFYVDVWEINANQTPDAAGHYTPAPELEFRALLQLTDHNTAFHNLQLGVYIGGGLVAPPFTDPTAMAGTLRVRHAAP